LQVLLFPFQAGGSGPGREQDFIVTVPDFPMLRGVVEFDVGGSGDFEPAKFMERNSLSPKAERCAVGLKRDLGVQDVSHCWLRIEGGCFPARGGSNAVYYCITVSHTNRRPP
jgi:hypothetical protein